MIAYECILALLSTQAAPSARNTLASTRTSTRTMLKRLRSFCRKAHPISYQGMLLGEPEPKEPSCTDGGSWGDMGSIHRIVSDASLFGSTKVFGRRCSHQSRRGDIVPHYRSLRGSRLSVSVCVCVCVCVSVCECPAVIWTCLRPLFSKRPR